MPLVPCAIKQHFDEKFKTIVALEATAADDRPYIIDSEEVPDRCGQVEGDWTSICGCRHAAKNVCVHGMSDEELALYTKLCTALGRYVDGIKKTANIDEYLLCFDGRGAGDAVVRTFAYLGQAIFNPKVQTMVRCLATSLACCTAGFPTKNNTTHQTVPLSAQ